MIIETKFNKGDDVYVIQQNSTPIYGKCPMCSGEGILFRKDSTEITCPKCKKTGEVHMGGNIIDVVVQGKIVGIRIFYMDYNDSKKDDSVWYQIYFYFAGVHNGVGDFKEEDIYLTEEAAQKTILSLRK